MICEIYDDVFDPEYLYQLYDVFESNINWKANNIANRYTYPYGKTGSHKLFGKSIFLRSGLNNIEYCDNENFKNFYDLYTYVCETKKVDHNSFLLKRVHVNLQHSGCDGTLHIDGGLKDISIMVFPNPVWEKDWGGKFQIFSENGEDLLEEHDYVPGRIIVFPSHLPHRGLGANIEYPFVYRYSIVFGILRT
tara:strand:+ start:54 stop:629 length:576 start_codon:yes stop_codon:yes gene_type:complete